jgi:predicted DNA-binding transcriptional regulator AlpA
MIHDFEDLKNYIEENERWVSISDASKMTHLSERTIWRYIESNTFISTKAFGRRIIDSHSIIAYMIEKGLIEYSKEYRVSENK